MTTRQLTVEEILNGTGLGRMQSVGHMSVIPILDDGDAQDDTFAPPDFSVNNHNYGSVDVQNEGDGPTILPTGSGWVTRQAAQDHAVPSAALIKKGERKHIDTAACIEESQGGYMRDAKELLIIPAQMRPQALATRAQKSYGKLWPVIREMNKELGVTAHGHLAYFLKHFEKELDEFVAEFELVPGQVGAVVLIGDNIVGIERAPTVDFWTKLWHPLIRVCYGALALKANKQLGNRLPAHRQGLDVRSKTLDGIREALNEAQAKVEGITEAAVRAVGSTLLSAADKADQEMLGYKVVTVASPQLSGQLVAKSRTKIPYASLCASGA